MENKIILYNLMEDKVAGYIIGDYTVLKGGIYITQNRRWS